MHCKYLTEVAHFMNIYLLLLSFSHEYSDSLEKLQRSLWGPNKEPSYQTSRVLRGLSHCRFNQSNGF